MKINVLDAAFGALLHDIGKFIQRAYLKSDLNEQELSVTPYSNLGNFHTHLHAGYTSRFLKDILKINNELERVTSEHHLPADDKNNLSKIIIDADRLASSIDRNDKIDEDFDVESNNQRNRFQTKRLDSVFSLVDFGKSKYPSTFELKNVSDFIYPDTNISKLDKVEAVSEYSQLYKEFLNKISKDTTLLNRVDYYSFNRLYALFYEYLCFVPASTYNQPKEFTSLFDHLKLTSAIASCKAISDSKNYRMLEFDISGIQKFIFKITEGSQQKRGIAKSLRGRSFLVSLITDYITMAYLDAFGLTVSNIIFNKGGGALLLLPDTENFDEGINTISKVLLKDLYSLFHTDLTFVYASVVLNDKELREFEIDKSIELKSKLDDEKAKKFSLIINENFFKEAVDKTDLCPICENNFTDQERCMTCQMARDISDFLVKNESLYIAFNFNNQFSFPKHLGVVLSLGYGSVFLTNDEGIKKVEDSVKYIESVNHSYLGLTRFIANSVPMKGKDMLSFEEICELAGKEYGDPKLGILKMDVDNLGAIFSYGLNEQRSISKYLTMSRYFELFFGLSLKQICEKVTKKFNSNIKTMFYINYAGGDDLVILGPAAGILVLAASIDKKLNEFTLNENITLSGGIFIQRPKEPIRFGIKKAESYLSMSKERDGKHGITLIDTTMSFDEFNKVLSDMEQFRKDINRKDINRKDINNGLISRTSFYQLMTMLNSENFSVIIKRIPVIFYSLKRNIVSKNPDEQEKYDKYRKEWIERISKIHNEQDMHYIRLLVLSMKLAIMQTREGDPE